MMRTKEEIILNLDILNNTKNLSEIIPIYLENKRNDNFLAKNYILKPNSENIKKSVYLFEDIIQYNNDKDFILEITKNYPALFLLASDDLRKNENFIIGLISQPRMILPYIEDSLKDNREIIKVALQHCAHLLQGEWYTKNYREDKELVLIVVANYPYMLRNVSPNLLEDRDVIKAAVLRYGENLKYTKKFLQDKELVEIALLDKSTRIYNYLPEKFQNDEELLLKVISHNPNLIKDLPTNYKNDPKIILAFLSKQNIDYYDRNYDDATCYIGKELSHVLLTHAKENKIDIYSMKNKIDFFVSVLQKLVLAKDLETDLPKNSTKQRHKL